MTTWYNKVEEIVNPWAERIVLQALLDNWNRKAEYELTEFDFNDSHYNMIFKLLERYNWNVDLVDGEFRKLWDTAEHQTWEDIQAWFNSSITSNFEESIWLVKQASKRKKQNIIARKLQTMITWWATDSEIMNVANELYETESIKKQPIDEIKNEIVSDAFWLGGDIKRFLTNYDDIDDITWGFYPNQLVTIAARPWVWKTLISINFLANQLQVWHKVAFFSLEMSTKEVYQRLYARFWNIEVNKLKWAKPLEKWDWERLNKAMELIDSLEDKFTIYDDKQWLWEIVNQIRLLHNKWAVDIVYIDYVGLVEVKAENRNLEISKITRTLKMLAMKLKIPIVIMAQLNRSVEKRYWWWDEPVLSDLRDSWSIEQDSDVVLMLHKPEDWILKILVRKNRNWPLWPCYVSIQPKYMQIWELSEERKQALINQQE